MSSLYKQFLYKQHPLVMDKCITCMREGMITGPASFKSVTVIPSNPVALFTCRELIKCCATPQRVSLSAKLQSAGLM